MLLKTFNLQQISVIRMGLIFSILKIIDNRKLDKQKNKIAFVNF